MRERGSAALELALGFALLLVPAVVVVLSFAPWLERREFVRTAAAEAARAAVVTTGDPASAASSTVAALAAARRLPEGSVVVRLCGGPPVAPGSGAGHCVLDRDGLLIVEVSAEVPLVATPWGDVGGLAVAAAHAEPVDAYRSLP